MYVLDIKVFSSDGVYIESNTWFKWNNHDKCNTNLLNIFGQIVFCKTEKNFWFSYKKIMCSAYLPVTKNYFLTITCGIPLLQLSNILEKRFTEEHLELVNYNRIILNNRQPYHYLIQVTHIKLIHTYLADGLFMTQYKSVSLRN